ncbi:tyrosine-type recombinase/integrase [Bacillus swezeyi]|uniref:tyrosine-type recombinase/integrase n=1 Tax=Bacillus swezeyi TaxID=1925020 RepID=UPI002DBBB6EA|nr:tyrosine-type recombinase/integrase [Bacillus swezeyi]
MDFSGDIIKNREPLLLPFDDILAQLLSIMLKKNGEIRRAYNKDNTFVFITKYGNQIAAGPSNNNIQKRLNRYAREYGLKNINPHALRRGFAKVFIVMKFQTNHLLIEVKYIYSFTQLKGGYDEAFSPYVEI